MGNMSEPKRRKFSDWREALAYRTATGPVVREDLGPCLDWTGSKCSDGYGTIWINGKSWGTHRAAWLLANGPIPDGMSVLHKCDRRCCIAPMHLELGTQKDNMSSASERGRMVGNRGMKFPGQNVGTKNPKVTLTEEQVYEIRECNEKQTDAARKYGVTQSMISAIRRRSSWTHLPERGALRTGNFKARKLEESDVYAIRESNERPVDLAKRYGVTGPAIVAIRTRRNWANLPERTVAREGACS